MMPVYFFPLPGEQGPPGEDGEDGADGPQGEQGPAGPVVHHWIALSDDGSAITDDTQWTEVVGASFVSGVLTNSIGPIGTLIATVVGGAQFRLWSSFPFAFQLGGVARIADGESIATTLQAAYVTYPETIHNLSIQVKPDTGGSITPLVGTLLRSDEFTA